MHKRKLPYRWALQMTMVCLCVGMTNAWAGTCDATQTGWVESAVHTAQEETEPKVKTRGGIGGTGAPLESSPQISQEAIKLRGLDYDAAAQPADQGLKASTFHAELGQIVVMGQVEAFPDLCVNGVRISFDEHTPVLKAGVPAQLSDIEAGQTLAIHGAIHGGVLEAKGIAILQSTSGEANGLGKDELALIKQLFMQAETAYIYGLPHKVDEQRFTLYGETVNLRSAGLSALHPNVFKLHKEQSEWLLMDTLKPTIQ